MRKAGVGLEGSFWGTPANVETQKPEGGGHQEKKCGMIFKDWGEQERWPMSLLIRKQKDRFRSPGWTGCSFD